MNRFQKKRTDKAGLLFALPVVLFVLVAGCMWRGIVSVSAQTAENQKKNLESAVHRDIVTCYALEGRYPESLDYLRDHYGLTFDEDRYVVGYEIVGSNLMPDVTVMEKQGGRK